MIYLSKKHSGFESSCSAQNMFFEIFPLFHMLFLHGAADTGFFTTLPAKFFPNTHFKSIEKEHSMNINGFSHALTTCYIGDTCLGSQFSADV